MTKYSQLHRDRCTGRFRIFLVLKCPDIGSRKMKPMSEVKWYFAVVVRLCEGREIFYQLNFMLFRHFTPEPPCADGTSGGMLLTVDLDET